MRIDYYQLRQTTVEARIGFACSLSAKIWRLGHQLLIQCASPENTTLLDEQLWGFQSAAFVPHDLLDHYDHTMAPHVVLTHDAQADGALVFNDCLMLFEGEPPTPEQSERFKRLLYLLPCQLAGANAYYKEMRARGHQQQHHKL